MSASMKRVNARVLTAIAVSAQTLGGVLYLRSYTPDPIGDGGGFAGRSDGMPDSLGLHAVIILCGGVGILSTIAAAALGPEGYRWPFKIGLSVSVVGVLAALWMAVKVMNSNGGLAILDLTFAVFGLVIVAVGSMCGFLATWPGRSTPHARSGPQSE